MYTTITALLLSTASFGLQQTQLPGPVAHFPDPTLKILPLIILDVVLPPLSFDTLRGPFRSGYQLYEENALAEYRRHLEKIVGSRALMTGDHDARMPTWDGQVPAIIVEPAIWYFDPASRVHQMATWPSISGGAMPPRPQANGPAERRTLVERFLELDKMPRSPLKFNFYFE